MSPVEKRTSGATIRAIFVLTFAMLALAMLVIWVLGIGDGEGVEFQLGDETFSPGDINNLARSIEADGPILWPDPGGFDNDIIVQHLGEDPMSGWLAFAARPEGTERPCTLGWRADTEDFQVGWSTRDEELNPDCSGEIFPADGGDQERFRVSVEEDGDLIVDLRDEANLEESDAE